jgi:hypothetical protein
MIRSESRLVTSANSARGLKFHSVYVGEKFHKIIDNGNLQDPKQRKKLLTALKGTKNGSEIFSTPFNLLLPV